ncbi:MAG: aminopeptidase P family protein [Alphaproteobacteria bacterium]|nr:MAG: aminopeptidase P family protein [Alphaproteobacteria bacterium]
MGDAAKRLEALREVLRARDLSGFIVSLVDEHGSEYVPAYARRLEWLTGFTGSAGSAVVLLEEAAIFVDGRYTLQAAEEVSARLYEHRGVPVDDPIDWIAGHAGAGARIGFDPRLHAHAWVEAACRRLAPHGIALVASEPNPIDVLWEDQPGRPAGPARPHPLEFAGVESAEKRAEIAEDLKHRGARGAIVAALDSIAWLFNIRGEDVVHTPVVLAYALLRADASADLFLSPDKRGEGLEEHLGADVRLHDYDDFYDFLARLSPHEGPLLADPASHNEAIFAALEKAGVTVVEGEDPCIIRKARKNPVEIAGAVSAHERDGVAVVEFLCWLDEALKAGEEIDELTAAARIEEFRRRQDRFVDLSFDTIAGAGPNGAIVHYRVSEKTNRRLEPGQLFLIDSGGQYLDGTTDITRTVPVGRVGEEERERFTLVLQGHIDLSMTRFAKGTSGINLDAVARRPLWRAGLDYDHGTGHGVGSYLSVHEGPQRIAKASSTVPLEPGMILSDEPGYYKAGHYGIRIENLVLVEEDETGDDGRHFYRFRPLTLAPIDRRLIVKDMLDAPQRRWLDRYHARVFETLAPHLTEEARRWLEHMTAPLG